jgi:hydrogenase expression/formation protein HypE
MTKKSIDVSSLSCPILLENYPNIVMAHGGGGKLTHQLISTMFQPLFKNEFLDLEHDGATINLEKNKIAVTTDSHVITPLFFPGGDIGKLSVYGTVNDLAMCGAIPKYLTLSFIIEEGLEMGTLWKICQSIQQAALETGVSIVTGDTKVISRNQGQDIYINTTGVGIVEHDLKIQPSSIQEGDAIIVNGDIGRHGIAIMATREGLKFESTIESDLAPLNEIVASLLSNSIPVHCLRDLTRGGLASAMIEIAKSADQNITLFDEKIPVREDVKGACEILGLDPIHVANEGKFAVIIPRDFAEKTLEIIKSFPLGKEAQIVGHVTKGDSGMVIMENAFGGKRVVEMFSGEQLPRIC